MCEAYGLTCGAIYDIYIPEMKNKQDPTKRGFRTYFDKAPGIVRVAWPSGWVESMTEREYHRFLKGCFGKGKRVNPWMPEVKKIGNRQNRRKTRQFLHTERFENIPQNKPVVREDKWNWD